MTKNASALIVRPPLDRSAPIRTADRFYRAASDDPSVIGGLPLDSVESAATAAVRLGYKIASAQIERSTRIAARLREAGDRAANINRPDGDSSEARALDATEQLILKAILAGLSWFEGVAATPGNPVRRFAAAEFRMLGSLLGLMPGERSEGGSGLDALRQVVERVLPSIDTLTAGARNPADESDGRARSVGRNPLDGRPLGTVLVKHAVGKRKGGGVPVVPRAVRVLDWELSSDQEGRFDLRFYGDSRQSAPLVATLTISAADPPTLTMNPMAARTARGAYRAAICNRSGVQLGFIEVAL